jgi:DNA-directed RNA polymerase sigma subunit (sigma70/sigma32)
MRTRMSAEEELRLVALARAGGREAEARLLASQLPPAYAVVNRYRLCSPVPKEDLEQEAALALLTAIRRFDPTRGVRLVSYAMWWVRVRVQRACRGWHHLLQEPPARGGRWLETMPDPMEYPSPAGIDLGILRELTPGRRAAVERVFGLNGHRPHTRREMAAALGIRLAAANKLYTRALAQLRRIVRHRDGRSRQAA